MGPTFPYKGGVAQHTTELAHRLEAAGHEVTIATWSRQYPERLYPGRQEIEEPEQAAFRATDRLLAWNRPDGWWRIGRALGRMHDVVCVAIVTSVQSPAYVTLLRAARSAGARTLAVAHNVLPHESWLPDRFLAKRLYRQVDGVLTHSDRETALARELGAAHVATAKMPFHFPIPDRPPVPAADPRNRIAFVGFVRKYKGLDLAVRSVARSRSRPELTVRGEFWDDVSRYRELAHRLGIDDRCEFVDAYASTVELVATIDAADAVIMPYLHATGTQQPRLARLRRRPSIVTDVGDLAQQVVDGIDGFVVPPDDEVALANAIDRLYEPGVLRTFATAIRPVDVATEWDEYVDALTSLSKAGTGDRPSR